jgi:hypothetical protein
MKLFYHRDNLILMAILSIMPVLYFTTLASADRALRCQGRLVYIGDNKADVVSKCGKPDHIEQWEENPNGHTSKIYDYEKERYQLPELIKGPILIERWTYDFGTNRFIRYLFFQNGELYKIERGDK